MYNSKDNKFKIKAHNKMQVFIDWDEIDTSDGDVDEGELINNHLFDTDTDGFIKEMQEVFNTQLDTIQLDYILQFYYGDISNSKNHNLNIEFIITGSDDFDREELAWLTEELFDICWERSDTIYGIEMTRTLDVNIDEIEEVK